MKSVQQIFHVDKPILAMLHLNGFTPERVHEWAKREIEQLYANGVDAILVEDYFGSPEDVEWALDELKRHYPEKAYGVKRVLSEAYFTLDLIRTDTIEMLPAVQEFGILTVTEGDMTLRWAGASLRMKAGDTCFLPKTSPDLALEGIGSAALAMPAQ